MVLEEDLQGFGKRCKEIHDKFDIMMKEIIKEHEDARKKDKGRGEKVRYLVDILLDISEDENTETILKRDDIKAFHHGMFLDTSICYV